MTEPGGLSGRPEMLRSSSRDEIGSMDEDLIGWDRVAAFPRRPRLRLGRWGTVHRIGAFVFVVAFLFVAVFPTRTYLTQRRELAASARRLALFVEENAKLQAAADRLQRDDEIERLARERFGLVKPGEEAYVVFPQSPTAPAVPPLVPPAESQPATGASRSLRPGTSSPRGFLLASLLKDVLQRLF